MKPATQAYDWDWHFAANAEPEWWEHSAKVLMAAADVLWDEFMRPVRESNALLAKHPGKDVSEHLYRSGQPQHGLAALLLSGYAIENILKGIHFRQWQLKQDLPIVNGRLNSYFTKHCLKRYADDAKISGLSDKDYDLLLRLQQCVEWTGKYPIATEAGLSKSGLTPFRVVLSDQCDDVHSLYARFKEFYEQLG